METLFEMPEPVKLRVGSNAWKLHEFWRMRELSKTEDGLTTPFFAKFALGVSRQRVDQLMHAGILPFHEIMGRRMISCRAIEELLKQNRTCGTRYSAGLPA